MAHHGVIHVGQRARRTERKKKDIYVMLIITRVTRGKQMKNDRAEEPSIMPEEHSGTHGERGQEKPNRYFQPKVSPQEGFPQRSQMSPEERSAIAPRPLRGGTPGPLLWGWSAGPSEFCHFISFSAGEEFVGLLAVWRLCRVTQVTTAPAAWLALAAFPQTQLAYFLPKRLNC